MKIEDLENEIWKTIPEYNGRYQVSNMGRVKSFSRNNPYLLSTKKKRLSRLYNC